MGGQDLMPKISQHISAIANYTTEDEQKPGPGAPMLTHIDIQTSTKNTFIYY